MQNHIREAEFPVNSIICLDARPTDPHHVNPDIPLTVDIDHVFNRLKLMNLLLYAAGGQRMSRPAAVKFLHSRPVLRNVLWVT